jgi:hypothetical protein
MFSGGYVPSRQEVSQDDYIAERKMLCLSVSDSWW